MIEAIKAAIYGATADTYPAWVEQAAVRVALLFGVKE
jgi:hypothetical protein